MDTATKESQSHTESSSSEDFWVSEQSSVGYELYDQSESEEDCE